MFKLYFYFNIINNEDLINYRNIELYEIYISYVYN